MRLLVCGGRDFKDYEALSMALHAVEALRGPIDVIIHGAARGADSLAQKWADEFGYACLQFPANWDRDGKAAGPIRNALMITHGKPDRVVAFPGGSGTADMIAKAKAAKIPVWVVNMKTREIETLAAVE